MSALRWITLAGVVWLSTGVLQAGFPIFFEQNANGQPYFYAFPDGHTVSGNYPNNNNWGQALVISVDGFGHPYESAPSNWSTSYYPGSISDPSPTNDDVFLSDHTVTLDVSVGIGTLSISSGGALNMLAGKSLSLVGDLSNDGTITIDSSGGGVTVLSFGGGTLTGAGSVTTDWDRG